MTYTEEARMTMTAPCLPVAHQIASDLLATPGDDALLERIWTATTNVRMSGGLNNRAKAVVHRALKRAGYQFWLLLELDEASGQSINSWGLSKEPPAGAVAGYTLNACAHRLGNGDSAAGWQIYWNQ